MADLPAKGSTLAIYQQYLRDEFKERGFDTESVEQKFMLFVEEVGEFSKAIRKQADIQYAEDSKTRDLEAEAGDVLILFLDICNQLGIGAEDALRNKQRNWA